MNNGSSNPIGIFDSGVGGFTVLREVEKFLPAESIIYFGDTARVPYGNKSKSTIIKFSRENVFFLLQKQVKMVIVACNTASSLALEYLNSTFNIPIIGVIEAGVRRAIKETSGSIGIIGTRSTIRSQSYQQYIKKSGKPIRIYIQSCPLFVPLVEEGILSGRIVKEAIKMYLGEFKRNKVDTVIMGCTHYPLLKTEIKKFLGEVYIVDSAKEVALHAKEVLDNKGLLNTSNTKARKDFYVSDEPEGFSALAKLFLKRNIPNPKVVNV